MDYLLAAFLSSTRLRNIGAMEDQDSMADTLLRRFVELGGRPASQHP